MSVLLTQDPAPSTFRTPEDPFAQAFLQPGGIAAVFFRQAAQLGARPFLHCWEDDGWQSWSWSDTARRVASLAAGLASLGVRRGDRVLLVSENRVEWHVSALAVLTLGAITVPLSTSATAEESTHIVRDAEPAAVIASAAQRLRLERLLATAGWTGPRIEIADTASAGAQAWQRLASGKAVPPPLPAVLDDVCCLIYTSGTGGLPKGVEQTHRNILSNAVGAAKNLEPYGIGGDRFLSFLPLSHTYEHTAGFVTPICLGAEIFVSRGPEHFARELRLAAPTVLIVVPRFAEVMQHRITTGLERQPAWRRRLFGRTAAIGRNSAGGERLPFADRVWDRTIGAFVRRQLRDHFGGALKCMLSAGAPLRDETALFFNGLGLPLHQGYGQTEAAPGITMQTAGNLRLGTVGTPMHGMRVRLAADGEILTQGPNVMRGYWRDPAATAAALRDGWLHTGDIGRIERDGSLVIVDRKKDFLKTAGGDMIAPQPIELALTAQPGVGQAMLCGDGWSHLAVLIVPDASLRERLSAGTLSLTEVEAVLQRAVDTVNATLPAKRRLRRLAVIPQPFSVENGLLTGTLKVRRRKVLATYADVVEKLAA